jgi:NAD(P)-dependent dehydrogenase (short-subunit alcohol dehydrogenase family)
MEIPYYTKIYHTTAYPSISPLLPTLSTARKSILITGAGSGIGPKLAEAFAIAGSTQIALLGRTLSTLSSTKSSLEASHPGIQVLTLVADLKDKSAIDSAFTSTKAAFGRIDMLISNAAYFSTGSLVSKAPVAEWWQSMEINVLGNLHLVQAFLANMDTSVTEYQPTIVNVSTLGVHIPALPSLSGYAVSKLAALKLFEYVAAENPSVRIMNVHPGSLDTAMGQKGRDAGVEAPFDDRKYTYQSSFASQKNTNALP